MKTLIIGLAVALVLAVAVLAVMTHQAKTPDKADCLYAAMAAYPDWENPGKVSMTETVPECEGMSETERHEIRTLMTAFTKAVLRNMQESES